MFIEDNDWNDEQASQALRKPLLNKAVENGTIKFKVKGVGKKSLLRTLQTLGTAAAPDQKEGGGVQKEDSGDSEPEESSAPARPKRKKKRNRGRKKTDDGETETAGLDDDKKKKKANSGPKEIKKKDGKKGSLKPKKADSGNGTSKAAPENNEESELSRKQWKNKMKNRRKCKNKYREKDLEVGESNMGEQRQVDTLSSNSDSKGTKMVSQSKAKQRKDPKPQNRKRTEPAESAPSETDDVQTLKPTNKRPKKDTKVSMLKQRVKTKAVGSPAKKPYESPAEVVEVEEEEEEGNSTASSKRQKFQKLHKESLKRKSLLKMLQSQPDEAQLPTGNQDPEEEEEVEEVQKEGGGTAAAAPEDRSASLRCRMEQRLEAARFRYINEVLYTSSSGEAKRMFSQDPQAFGVYHKGFTAQVQRWPANPVDAIIAYIQKKPASQVVADFGCGDCKIARSVKNKVHSFDLAPVCGQVTVCDMAHVPLKDASVHIAVFCLSLMGTNLIDFLAEANRVLAMGGVLKIAEVASRFDDLRGFLSTLSNLGFKMMLKDTKNSHFYSFDFVKTKDVSESMKSSRLELKPCVYKKR